MSNKKIERILELRALPGDRKAIEEQRADLVSAMDNLINGAKEESRALTEEEDNHFNEIATQIAQIDKTIKADETRRALDNIVITKKETTTKTKEEEQRATDEENFLKFIKGETRALDIANNGGIIPTTISNRIIERVKEISPIYSLTTHFNISGDLVFPLYDENNSSIGATYAEDLQELTEGTGKFITIKLENFIVGCLAKVSKSLINRNDFDLVSFVVNKVAEAISNFLEKELIQGTPKKMQGLESTTNIVTAVAADKVTADELIDVQDSIPDQFQANACWIMNKQTRRAIRKLKDAEGNYLLNKDLTNGFGWILLGKPVYISENANKMEAGKKTIFYGDMSGLYAKLTKDMEIQILMEKYATQHAIGVVGYIEADSKIVETQKIVALQMKA